MSIRFARIRSTNVAPKFLGRCVKQFSTSFLSRNTNALSKVRKSSNGWENIFKQINETSPPITNINSALEPFDQLKEVVKKPLWQIYWKLVNREFELPFSNMNNLSNDRVNNLIESFTEKLMLQFEIYLHDPSNSRPILDIKLVDYINPKICNITQIIYLINNDTIPTQLPLFYGYNTKTDCLTNILTKLIYKEYVESSLTHTKQQDSLVDLSNPAEWFPEARKMKRKFIMHVGPTNSGKTYNSLQKLAKAKSGYYAGPLRLLAREIYERFHDQGIKCNLITGEEVIPSIDSFGKISEISSGTIEMIPSHKKMDICIIDEIQMIADPRRGEAWTNAVLGVQAKEIHMCGEESAVPLILKLAKITGDEVEINKYNRLGKLTVCNKEVNNFKNLQKGDCVIAFSKRKILELKCEIERSTNLKVGVIYGALPPEIRSKEANGFNSGHYDVLVASDAVGMGLNLKIKRIVFYATKKFNGNETIPLTASETKQISGRAGRFSKDEGELEGFVTAMYKKDLLFLKKMMNEPIQNLSKACTWPTDKVWTYYMSKFPKYTSFYDILAQFEKETTSIEMENFFITALDSRYEILNLFLRNDLYKKTTIEDQLRLSLAPININMSSPLVVDTALKFFQNITKCETKNIFDFNFLHTETLKRRPKFTATTEQTVQTLQSLEENHKLVLIFLWLSQRWPTLFVDKESATETKTLIEKRISEELLNLRRLIKNSRSVGIEPRRSNPKSFKYRSSQQK
ncbi:unnamed protein product [Debaryomyces fabryi]|nr:unnamed protein product [Debaryomyces fabryi]